MSATKTRSSETEVSILLRVLGGARGEFSPELARHILELGFSDRDKARMHDLVTRNQADALTPAEKEEMHAFGWVGDLLAILKSRARRSLGIKLKAHSEAL